MSHVDPLADREVDLFSNEYLMKPRAVEEAMKKLREMGDEQDFRRKISETFSSKAGLDVLEWLLESLRIHATAFTGNAYTNYNCALKDFAGELHDLVLHANPILAFRLTKRRYIRSRNADLDVQARLESFIQEEETK